MQPCSAPCQAAQTSPVGSYWGIEVEHSGTEPVLAVLLSLPSCSNSCSELRACCSNRSQYCIQLIQCSPVQLRNCQPPSQVHCEELRGQKFGAPNGCAAGLGLLYSAELIDLLNFVTAQLANYPYRGSGRARFASLRTVSVSSGSRESTSGSCGSKALCGLHPAWHKPPGLKHQIGKKSPLYGRGLDTGNRTIF